MNTLLPNKNFHGLKMAFNRPHSHCGIRKKPNFVSNYATRQFSKISLFTRPKSAFSLDRFKDSRIANRKSLSKTQNINISNYLKTSTLIPKSHERKPEESNLNKRRLNTTCQLKLSHKNFNLSSQFAFRKIERTNNNTNTSSYTKKTVPVNFYRTLHSLKLADAIYDFESIKSLQKFTSNRSESNHKSKAACVKDDFHRKLHKGQYRPKYNNSINLFNNVLDDAKYCPALTISCKIAQIHPRKEINNGRPVRKIRPKTAENKWNAQLPGSPKNDQLLLTDDKKLQIHFRVPTPYITAEKESDWNFPIEPKKLEN